MTKSKAAFLFASQTLGKQKLFLWTFTFKELLAVKETRKRWNHLLTLLQRQWPNLQGLRVYELHKEHGLHVHLVTNRFIDVNRARELATQAGWGRIHVTRMPCEHAGYLAKYLSKERPECLFRWRLWAGFGKGWEWTRVKDVIRETLFSKIYRACKEWKGWTGRGNFFERVDLVRRMMILTIENGWEAGRGANSLPYSEYLESNGSNRLLDVYRRCESLSDVSKTGSLAADSDQSFRTPVTLAVCSSSVLI